MRYSPWLGPELYLLAQGGAAWQRAVEKARAQGDLVPSLESFLIHYAVEQLGMTGDQAQNMVASLQRPIATIRARLAEQDAADG